MSTKKGRKAPKHGRNAPIAESAVLGAEGQRFFDDVTKDYELEPHHLELLRAASVAVDRIVDARRLLERDGPIVQDRWGCPKKHPACDLEIENVRLLKALIRELGLDLAPVEPYERGPRAPGTAGRS